MDPSYTSPAVYFSAHKFPSLAGRPRAERTEIIGAALKAHGGAYGARLFLALLATAICIVLFDRSLAPHAPLSDWRRWVGVVVGGGLLYGYLLWEINRTVYRAVEKYLAARNGR
jgi:hypothetical protein